ncbi:MAG: FAD:protein FMN transferase [Gemmatimonadota bacterium]
MRAAQTDADQPAGDAARVAHTLAALRALGLERVESPEAAFSAVRLDPALWQVTAERPAMSTLVSVTALGPSRERMEEAIGRSFEAMQRLIDLLTRFDAASPVSVLNETGRLDRPPPEVEEVVSQALGYHRLTRGAFDVSVAPLVDLFQERLVRATPVEPTPAEVADALARVGAEHVALSQHRIGLGRPGMRLTLDGIAKGYIVDAICAELDRRGVRRYLVNAGGDIRTRGLNSRGQAWTIAVENPWRRGDYPDALCLTDAAVATSGNYERSFDAARRYHHIVNAASGRSPVHCSSVTVVAPTALAADALATSAFVMGPRGGIALIEALPGCACLILDHEGREHRSRTWRSATPLNGGSETS